jgi:hypothetical protein
MTRSAGVRVPKIIERKLVQATTLAIEGDKSKLQDDEMIRLPGKISVIV